MNQQIENNFSYHPPKEGQPEKYQSIRDKAKEFAYVINDLVPNSTEKSIAMTNLEQAVFWANAGIARSKTEDNVIRHNIAYNEDGTPVVVYDSAQ